MKQLDAKISSVIVNLVRRSRLASFWAAVGASHLIWFVLGFAYATAWYREGVDSGPEQIGFLTRMIVVAWLLTLGIEYLVRRPRPFERGQKPIIDMLLKTPSFPSGHATISFAIASAMSFIDATLFPWYRLLAIVISLSRVAVGVHYLTDVLAGAFVGSLLPWGLVALSFLVFA